MIGQLLNNNQEGGTNRSDLPQVSYLARILLNRWPFIDLPLFTFLIKPLTFTFIAIWQLNFLWRD